MTATEHGPRRTGAAATAVILLVLSVLLCAATRSGTSYALVLAAVPVFAGLQTLWFRLTDKAGSRGPIRLMLFLAVISHTLFAFLADPEYTSDDINRYVFEGHVVSAGGNPYRFPPASPLFDNLTESRSLAAIRTRVNHSRIATIYPPVAEWLFCVGTMIAPGLRGWMVLNLGFDLVILLLLPRTLRAWKRDERWTVFYAFHPLVLLEGVAGAHIDLAAVAFLMLAVLAAAQRRMISAWVLFALSALTKIPALIAGFSVLRQCSWRGGFAAAAVISASMVFCFRDGHIEPSPPEGAWQIVAGTDAGSRIRVWKNGEFLFPEPGTEMIWSASGRAGLRIGTTGNRPESRQLIRHSRLRNREGDLWRRAVGHFRIALFGEERGEYDGRLVEFDGQGRIDGIPEGRYWVEEEKLVLSWREGVIGSFLMSDDSQLISPVDPTTGLWLIKYDEVPGMGFRHYAGRWTANAPLFQAVSDRMPGEDVYDEKRRAAQKVIAALLIALALVFMSLQVELPRAAAWLVFALWLTAQALYPWYLLWLVPLVGFTGAITPLVFSWSCLALHLSSADLWIERTMMGTPLPYWLAFAPLVLAAVFDIMRMIRKPRTTT